MNIKNYLITVYLLLIIANGFGQIAPMSIVKDTARFKYPYNSSTTVSAVGHKFIWRDANNQQRSAVMVDQSASGCGYLREFTYSVGGVNRVCAGTGSNGAETFGDGFVQNHTGNGNDCEATLKPGTTVFPLIGKHHGIIKFNIPNYPMSDPGSGGGAVSGIVPTSVEWFFASGRDYPIYSLSQDARKTVGNLGGDSRSPYGDMHFDGTLYTKGPAGGDLIGGVSMGTNYKWVSLVNGTTNESKLLATNSGWRYDEANTIPYAMEWTKNINAEQGHVQTQPITIKDAGRKDYTYPALPHPLVGGIKSIYGPMITDEQWPYQIANYLNSPTDSGFSMNGCSIKRLTWGTAYGAIGGFDDWTPSLFNKTDFTQYYNGQRTTGGKGLFLAYSIVDVFGLHTPNGTYASDAYKTGAVGKMVTQMENMQLATLTASVGTVLTSGPAGVQGSSSPTVPTVNYVPVGYNHVYATWEVAAVNNVANISLTPHAGNPIDHPIFVINNYKAATTPSPSICINGLSSKADSSYFLSIDSANNKLWITLNTSISQTTRLEVNTGSCKILLPISEVTLQTNQNNGNAYLSWQSFINNDYRFFEIERSIDGKNFTTIAIEKENINHTNSYHFIDKSPEKGFNYYRLKIVNMNGKASYSNIAILHIITNQLTIAPNPANYFALLHLSKATQKIPIVIYNQLGKKENVIAIQKDAFTYLLDTQNLPNGIYLVQAKSINDCYIQKLIISRY